jgi:SAM-dependent methyltransferase
MAGELEIYEKHARDYDAFVRAEDYQGNLNRFLHEIADWRDAAVLEGGTGTGRITRLYLDEVKSAVCCDRSKHMLDFAKNGLVAYKDKITFLHADNTELPDLESQCDIFVEGWSFCYSLSSPFATLINNAEKNVRSGGTVILIESLGTNVPVPGVKTKELRALYKTLVGNYGFSEEVISTDYRFESKKEAAQRMGFFFGEEMREAVRAIDSTIIPEFTGVWWKRV